MKRLYKIVGERKQEWGSTNFTSTKHYYLFSVPILDGVPKILFVYATDFQRKIFLFIQCVHKLLSGFFIHHNF